MLQNSPVSVEDRGFLFLIRLFYILTECAFWPIPTEHLPETLK
jgi:hypothetical protein